LRRVNHKTATFDLLPDRGISTKDREGKAIGRNIAFFVKGRGGR